MMRQANVPIIWVLGGPGSGKGTQCAKIVEKYQLTHISTGDLLRAEVASGSDKGKELQAILAKGDLAPNEEVLGLLEKAMVSSLDTSLGYLIDGYPRELGQGAAFEEFIAPVDIIIYFECSAEAMTARILGRAAAQGDMARADDNEATIVNRIQTFRTNSEKILEQYPAQTRRINAEGQPDSVFALVQPVIEEMIDAKKKSVAVN